MLLDSNIIIYASMPEHEDLRRFIAEYAPSVSVISKIETLGYHKLQEEEHTYLLEFFGAADVIPLSDEVVALAIRIRQQRRMTLGDALIGGTALAHDIPLVTRNVADFSYIENLEIVDPLRHRL